MRAPKISRSHRRVGHHGFSGAKGQRAAIVLHIQNRADAHHFAQIVFDQKDRLATGV